MILWLWLACSAVKTAESHPIATPETPAEQTMASCSVRLNPGDSIKEHLTDGATICLSAGTYAGGLTIDKSVSLIGEGTVVLDGGGNLPVISIQEHRLEITLKGLILTGGASEFGSGLQLEGYSQLTLEDCIFRGNHTPGEGGPALGARRGKVTLRNCHFSDQNSIVITGVAIADFYNCDIASNLTILDGAEVALHKGAVHGTLTTRGTTSRRPKVTLQDCKPNTINDDPNLGAQWGNSTN